MKKMTQEQFNEWVAKMCVEYSNSSFLTRLCDDGKTIIAISKHGNRIGKATCHEDDTFDRRIGTAIAFARAIGQEVPTIIDKVEINSLCYGDKFIYDNHRYIYIAKHPTISKRHIAILERNTCTYRFMGTTLVEKI